MSFSDMGRSMLRPRWIVGFAVLLVTLITLFTHTASRSVGGLVGSISTSVSALHTHHDTKILTTLLETLNLYNLHFISQQWQGWSPLPHSCNK